MKAATQMIAAALVVFCTDARGQAGDDYTNFLRQVQLPTNVIWDVSVAEEGESQSGLAIDPGGARFELWTVKADPLTVYLLDSKYVGTYVPMASVSITTEDENTFNAIPRTRADRPFIVNVSVEGMVEPGEDVQEAATMVKLLRHVQSYGTDGSGVGIDRDQATLLDQRYLTENATYQLSYEVTAIPGSDRTKVRGEERFSVYSLEDYQANESQLASMFVQIWPVADGEIAGIESGEEFTFKVPEITLTLNDLYPDSQTYAQVYKGQEALGTEGKVIAGSFLSVYDSVPNDRVLVIDDWDSAITEDGVWTMELLTSTPFGIDRLDFVTFEVDRTIEMKGSFTTIE
ncbi:MAG: hypothetical protein ACQCXQ_02055 [Verrucomicrobiales bacterium]|nr:hypothetical protein [Verrucomicrobiota bacterium JB025]